MIQVIYQVAKEQKDEELSWLRDQRIFPSTKDIFSFSRGSEVSFFGMYLTKEQASLVKLRHPELSLTVK